MGIYESLAVCGTSYWLAGCYAIFEKSNVEQAKAGLIATSSDVDVYVLDDEWKYPILLTERRIDQRELFASSAIELMNNSFNEVGCMACVCLLDGSFEEFGSLLSPDLASHTYGYCLSKHGSVVSLNDEMLNSPQWGQIIESARKELAGLFENEKKCQLNRKRTSKFDPAQ